jgi:general secretion pathway protein G
MTLRTKAIQPDADVATVCNLTDVLPGIQNTRSPNCRRNQRPAGPHDLHGPKEGSMTVRYRGFTLIELLVVLVILGLLMGVVVPQVVGYVGRSKTSTAEMQVEQLATGLDLFRLDVGRYPSSEEGLEALIRDKPGIDNWNGPYLQRGKLPDDPWGQPYRYRNPGEHGPYDLFSLGADDSPGGEGESQDVTSWNE